jgi:hypothetical protein
VTQARQRLDRKVGLVVRRPEYPRVLQQLRDVSVVKPVQILFAAVFRQVVPRNADSSIQSVLPIKKIQFATIGGKTLLQALQSNFSLDVV